LFLYTLFHPGLRIERRNKRKRAIRARAGNHPVMAGAPESEASPVGSPSGNGLASGNGLGGGNGLAPTNGAGPSISSEREPGPTTAFN